MTRLVLRYAHKSFMTSCRFESYSLREIKFFFLSSLGVASRANVTEADDSPFDEPSFRISSRILAISSRICRRSTSKAPSFRAGAFSLLGHGCREIRRFLTQRGQHRGQIDDQPIGAHLPVRFVIGPLRIRSATHAPRRSPGHRSYRMKTPVDFWSAPRKSFFPRYPAVGGDHRRSDAGPPYKTLARQ